MASKRLKPEQRKELKECFDLFDQDKSGTISIVELKNICRELELNVSDEDVKSIMKLMDTDNSDQIDFDEFADVMADQFYKPPSVQELTEAFAYFDKDKSGFITEDELFEVMSRFKKGISKSEIKKMIDAIDKNNDGRVNLEEFLALFKR